MMNEPSTNPPNCTAASISTELKNLLGQLIAPPASDWEQELQLRAPTALYSVIGLFCALDPDAKGVINHMQECGFLSQLLESEAGRAHGSYGHIEVSHSYELLKRIGAEPALIDSSTDSFNLCYIGHFLWMNVHSNQPAPASAICMAAAFLHSNRKQGAELDLGQFCERAENFNISRNIYALHQVREAYETLQRIGLRNAMAKVGQDYLVRRENYKLQELDDTAGWVD